MLRFLCLFLLLGVVTSRAVIVISGVADKTKYNTSVTFTVTADPGAATTTATLDGVPVTVGAAVIVNAASYHELKAESRTAANVLVDSKTIRFIVTAAGRNGTEDGIPPFTPFKTVNDAPSAFAGKTLKVIAPAVWPTGLPVPMVTLLRGAGDETVRLNGLVSFAGFPGTTIQMRRGWGSGLAPARTAAGTVNVNARVAGLSHNPSISIVDSPAFTNVSGILAANTNWPANSRIAVTGTLTINTGITLTVGAGTIVKMYSGTSTNGTAAEIIVNGTLQINGVDGNPVVFTPDVAGAYWGGIEMPTATSTVNAAHTIFTGSGEDETWFDTHSGYSTHKPQQALFLISGSGSGTAVGAQLHLQDCYCFSLAGQEMNSRTNTWIDLLRTLMQRAVTCGELNGSKVTIDRSALIEFPAEDATFVDGDNDAIYLTNGDLSITNSVIGFCKDDGVDSGASGGDNPYTAAADVTPFYSTGNWYEGAYHEGNSLSGTRNVFFTNCVFHNCGQGVEDGYSNSGTSDGPNATVDGCLFTGNMVGVRWGDNYGSGYSYNGSMEVKNSVLLHSLYKDAFSGQWHPTAASAWIYQTTATNSFGRPYFNVHDNHLSQPDPVNHPANTTWNGASHAALIAPFMPVPGSMVGVAISSYAPAQGSPDSYPGVFNVRLSSFSSQPVSVGYSVIGKTDPMAVAETVLGSGTVNFQPGETTKSITPAVASPGNYAVIHVDLTNPVNAEITGEAWYIKAPLTPSPTLIARGSAGWRYRETRSEPPADWRTLEFDDSSGAATEWLPGTLPAGFGATVVTTVASGPGTDRTTAFYFRKKFTVSDPSQISALAFSVRRDDAVVVYLNNDSSPTLVSADGTFNPPYTYAATNIATLNVPNSTNTGNYLTFSLPPAKLVAGQNIIAISLHQTSLTSSDILLDCDLTASFKVPFDLSLGKIGNQSILYWFYPGALLESSTDLNFWNPLTSSSPHPMEMDITREFFRLTR